jgi:hypothetical protein
MTGDSLGDKLNAEYRGFNFYFYNSDIILGLMTFLALMSY